MSMEGARRPELRGRSAPTGTEPLSSDLDRDEAIGISGDVALFAYCGEHISVLPLSPGRPVVLGRAMPSSLVVPDSKLSRQHARFTRDGERVLVEDLGSRNGMFVAGERLVRAELGPGDEVVLGSTLVRVRGPRPVPPIASGEAFFGGPTMRSLLVDVERVASSQIPVILHGETGSGKEVIAQLIHDRGPRAAGQIVRVNCAAIPAQLVESALFGHERGAFTGALTRQRGVFEEADGGTVFLDEIGELPLAAQASMLRVLETGRFARVGSVQEVAVDARVIAATHRSLESLVAEGKFREDLYYRLNALTLEIPPLRARRADIEPIARRLLAQSARKNGRVVTGISRAAVELLERYRWPGNVRDLRNAIDSAVVVARDEVIRDVDLPPRVRQPEEAPPTSAAAPEHVDAEISDDNEVGGEIRIRLQEYEVRLITAALRSVSGSRTEAARILGLPIRTLTRRIQQLGIKDKGE